MQKNRGLLHNNPSLNGLQAFSKLTKIIPVNFPTAILKVHFMRPKLPEIWFKKILVLPPSNLISGHRQLTRNPLICRWQNICWHTFAPRLYNVCNRLKSFLVNGDENQPKNVYNATKRHFWGGENELAGKRRDGLRHFLDDQHPTVPSCPSWGMVGWGTGLDLLHMESVKGQAIRLWSIEQGARANINSRTSRKARKSSNLDQGYHSKGEVKRKFWTRAGSEHLTGILQTSSLCQYCDKSTDFNVFLTCLSIYNVNVLRTKEILGCD